MLQNTEQGHAVLIDYGGVVRIDTAVIEFTAQYCMDRNPNAGTEYMDWICLATTLAEIAGFEIFDFYSVYDLEDAVTKMNILSNSFWRAYSIHRNPKLKLHYSTWRLRYAVYKADSL
jgi:hypothetical protein